jgi:hypothetical protein
LQTVIANPVRADDLAAALSNHDAVISCLGQRSRGDATVVFLSLRHFSPFNIIASH